MADASGPDAALVARCRDGDERAWAELVDRFSRYVFAIATQAFRLGREDAEDVFQEVFARTYANLGKLRDDEAIRPWIGQLCRRLCIDRLRLASRAERGDVDADLEDAEDTIARLDDALTVHQALDRLAEHCREILDRFFSRDESYHTIGEQLGVAPGTVASRISRCLAKLREMLEGRETAAITSSDRWSS